MPTEESYKAIEGEWKEFRFRRIEPKDHKAVFEHLTEFFSKDEPTSKLLGWVPEFAEDLNNVVARFLPDGLSFLCEHIPSGEVLEKRIAAVRITFNHHPERTFSELAFKCENTKLVLKLLKDVETDADVPKRYGIDSWAEFYATSTHRDFRGQGIAGEFYSRSISFLKAAGFKHALVIASSPFTQIATKKRGFDECARINYEDFVGFDGKPVFKKEDITPEHCALVMVKTL